MNCETQLTSHFFFSLLPHCNKIFLNGEFRSYGIKMEKYCQGWMRKLGKHGTCLEPPKIPNVHDICIFVVILKVWREIVTNADCHSLKSKLTCCNYVCCVVSWQKTKKKINNLLSSCHRNVGKLTLSRFLTFFLWNDFNNKSVITDIFCWFSVFFEFRGAG